VGISQKREREMLKRLSGSMGFTFPVLLDNTDTYPVSNAYGLTNVPSTSGFGQDGEIEISSVGWIRKENGRDESPRRRNLRRQLCPALSIG